MPEPIQLLLAEDDPVLARAVKRLLCAAGHQVTSVSSAAEAPADGSFNVAVLDIDLGNGSGLDLAEALLQSGRARAIVFYSATRDPAQIERAQSLGVLVPKSAQLGALLAAVTATLAAS